MKVIPETCHAHEIRVSGTGSIHLLGALLVSEGIILPVVGVSGDNFSINNGLRSHLPEGG
jgi:hypothetical protein